MIDFLLAPWPWWFSGLIISAIMFALLFFGKTFGFSSNLKTICSMGGAGKKLSFFDFNWKEKIWNIVFLIGAILGGFIAQEFLSPGNEPIDISKETISDLKSMGFKAPKTLQPMELFSNASVFDLKAFLLLGIGGLFIGFGSRYAGGCTSGHAISGISNLQLPSLIASIGFFIGGLIMTHTIFPYLFPALI